MSARIYIPLIVNLLFLHDVQICMCRTCHINVFQWNRECFFLRHVELNSRFIVMTMDEVTLDRPELGASASSVDSVGWDSSGSPWGSLLESSLLKIRSLLLTTLVYHLLQGIGIHLLCVLSILLSRWFFEHVFPMRPSFQLFNICNQNISFPFPHAISS